MSTLLVPVFSLCLTHQHHCSPSELVVNSVKAPQGEDWWKGGSRSGQSLSWSVQTQKTWPLASANQRRCLWGRTWHERKEKVAVYMGTWRRWSRSSGFTYGRYSLMSDGQDKTCGGGRWRGKEKTRRSRATFLLHSQTQGCSLPGWETGSSSSQDYVAGGMRWLLLLHALFALNPLKVPYVERRKIWNGNRNESKSSQSESEERKE